MKRQYFYDKQFRRYITQLIRLFSGFQVQYLTTKDGETIEMYRNIPCIWGDMSRMGATWLNKNSENIHNAAPIMALNVTSITPSPEYRMSPYFQEDTHFSKKKKNPTSKGYVNEPETMYKVSQHMPVPYELAFNLDIIVTSTDQKLEILEQILGLYNPGFQMRSNSSPFDIGKYFEITLDSIQWTSKSVPQGASVENDIATLSFIVKPIYINVPSKIRRNTIIKRVITNVNIEDHDLLSTTLDQVIDPDNPFISHTESIVVTPTDYSFEVYKDEGEYYGKVFDNAETSHEWETVFESYGTSTENDTWIRIRRTEDEDEQNFDVYMMYEYTDDPTIIKLKLDENSFKVPNVEPVDRIINPNKKHPSIYGNGYGTRYLISKDIETEEWGMRAPAMSIIESTEEGWVVTFDPEEQPESYVVNLNTGDQYFFDGYQWTHYIVGRYHPRYWMFDVQNVNECQ